MNKQYSVSVSPGFFCLLAILFIGLKLTNYIDWSWWWVLSPLWLPAAVFIIVAIAVVAVALSRG